MDSPYAKSEWMDSPQQQLLLDLYFKDSPIQIEWDFHGTQKVKDNKLIFGPYAGPEACITSLIHEMAHLAEIDDARILKHNWGLTLPEQYIPGRYSRMAPVTCQATFRECRVLAMQWHIQNSIGICIPRRQMVEVLQWMPDFCLVPRSITCKGNDLQSIDNARFIFLEGVVHTYCKRGFGFKHFVTEWDRKNELLKQFL